jgi:hypothetical protein
MKHRSAFIVGILFAAMVGSLAMTSVAAQQPPELSFEYTKSGGIAGVNERITFESQTANDSKSNIIKFFKDGTVAEKILSAESVENIRETISNSGFFEMNNTYPPGVDGAADYFSHSLNVTLDGQNHSVSWVDEFASSSPLPPGLESIVGAIKEAYANGIAVDAPLDNGKRRVTGTIVRQSSAHNAEGHSSHQAAYLLLAQPGYLYNSAVTFSSSRPVDILAYHEITGTATETLSGVAVHVVDGRSFAVTTLLKNVTSGSVNFVGSGVLAHTAAADPYTIVATVDAIRKTSTLPTAGKSFTVEVSGERFVVRATDAETITQLTDNYKGLNRMHVTGELGRGDGGFNQPWGWHLDPASVRMAEVSIELCDGRPSMVQDDLEYWLDTVGTFCPWSSKVVEIS